MKPRIVLDMDGVLADFETQACNAHGVPKDLYYKRQPVGKWEMFDGLGIPTASKEEAAVALERFWYPIDEIGECFWTDMPALPWLTNLIQLVYKWTDDWYIATSYPHQALLGYTGKVKWIKKVFGQRFDRHLITSHKYVLANDTTILIDDSEHHVNQFTRHGGHGLLFPSRANYLHRFSDDPVNYIENVFNNHFTHLFLHRKHHPDRS